MSKKVLTYITAIIIPVTLISGIIWAFNAADADGTIHLEGNETYAYLFLGLSITGLITGSIALKATNEKGDKISKKTILSGLALAAIFFLWRLSVAL
ncbi:hypothetical protein J7E38_16870 [Bacillus sp. ISL-35]|jgi:hypothetical protein|uniref:hypothetical protein n=1 Tax=Bacillus sp. ISL-35 TaxID=2819122 RepID=UPI001BE74666|nr:hypothetical protein [Bacillus sp. ISL-35]MBT2680685.1 hypothetical protein [Bacillus sp. ISL-35]MBT2702684.1 hypothetical protein [Chryseobacterium sp. ISL-80]